MTLHLVLGEDGPEAVSENGNWLLNKETGFSPLKTFIFSVAGCSSGVYSDILKNSKIDFTMHDIQVNYEISDVKPRPVTAIDIHFDMTVAKKDQGRAERAIKMISKYCPVIQSIDPKIKVTENVSFR